MKKLTHERGTSVIWISHDLGVVAGLCDRVNVMYAGRVVETSPIRDLFKHPRHGYTLGLMGSTPRLDGMQRRLTPIEGLPPNLTEPTDPVPVPAALPGLGRSLPPAAARTASFGPEHTAVCLADLGP